MVFVLSCTFGFFFLVFFKQLVVEQQRVDLRAEKDDIHTGVKPEHQKNHRRQTAVERIRSRAVDVERIEEREPNPADRRQRRAREFVEQLGLARGQELVQEREKD